MGVSTGAIIDFKSYYVGRNYVLFPRTGRAILSDSLTVSG